MLTNDHAQRPGARDATIATATPLPGSLQRIVRPCCHLLRLQCRQPPKNTNAKSPQSGRTRLKPIHAPAVTEPLRYHRSAPMRTPRTARKRQMTSGSSLNANARRRKGERHFVFMRVQRPNFQAQRTRPLKVCSRLVPIVVCENRDASILCMCLRMPNAGPPARSRALAGQAAPSVSRYSRSTHLMTSLPRVARVAGCLSRNRRCASRPSRTQPATITGDAFKHARKPWEYQTPLIAQSQSACWRRQSSKNSQQTVARLVSASFAKCGRPARCCLVAAQCTLVG